MLRAWVVVIAAGVAAPAIALAEPTDKNDKSDKKSTAKSDKSKSSKSDGSEKSTKSSEKSTKSAKAESSARSKSSKSERSERSDSSEKSSKSKKTAKSSTGKKREGKGTTAKARLTTQKFRGPMRTDNGPAGFTWPPTPQMIAAEKACEERLDLAGVPWRSVEGDGHMADAVVIDGGIKLGGVAYTNVWGGKGPYKLDCQLAVALETVGTELYAIGVREVRFGSIYSWRRIHAFGKTSNILTRHALGLAMDIAEFVDDKGRVANVLAHYAKGDPLLHAIEDTINNSHRFRVLLSPKNDPVSHSNHFHIEAASDFFAKPE